MSKMWIKAGVSIVRLEKPARMALNVVGMVLDQNGIDLYVTSTDEGNHSKGSLHYANLAFDMGIKGVTQKMIDDIRKHLNGNVKKYDVIDENDHIHIEYDPK